MPGAPHHGTVKARQRQMREDAILDAARELLAVRGFAELTLEAVIERVGISKPTFYGHFASKEELGVRILLRALREARDEAAALADALPPETALRRLTDWLLDRHFGPTSDRDFSGALLLFAHEDVRAAERDFVKQVAALVGKAQRSGAMAGKAPPQLVAQTLQSILKDIAYDEPHRRGRLDLAALKSGVAALLLGA